MDLSLTNCELNKSFLFIKLVLQVFHDINEKLIPKASAFRGELMKLEQFTMDNMRKQEFPRLGNQLDTGNKGPWSQRTNDRVPPSETGKYKGGQF